MNLDDAARELIGAGTDATLVTLNPDGSPQVTVVWMALESTPDGDELVSAHLTEYRKTRNIRRDPRVAVTILSPRQPGQQTPYLAITGTARIVEGGAPELLKKLAKADARQRRTLPPAQFAAGTAHPHPDRQGGRLRSLGVLTANKLSRRSPRVPSCEATMQGGDAAMSARAKSRVSRWFVLLFATLTVCGAVLATPATAIDTPIGRLVHAVKMPVPYAMGLSFVFKGVTPTGDAYEPRNSDAPDALQYAIQNVPAGATVNGGVWWDCYRDLVSNVVLVDKVTGFHLAQWNL